MHRVWLHPALRLLLRDQAAARLGRTMRGFRDPQRFFLTLLGLALALVWLGQAALGVLFREPADPTKLPLWISSGLLAYALWHLVKTACVRPADPMHWNQAEQELLQAAPLPRSQLLGYRLTTIGIATAAKSLCFVIVMLPDVRYTLPALFGIFCALLFVDLLRISFETFAYGIPAKARSQFRWTVLTLAGLCIAYATANCVFTADIIRANEPPEPLATIFRFGRGCQELLETGIGQFIHLPFQLFASIILSLDPAGVLALKSLCAIVLVAATSSAVIWLDRRAVAWRLQQEHNRFRDCLSHAIESEESSGSSSSINSQIPPRWCGAGALAWRQLLGAYHNRTSVLVALLLPALLSSTALLSHQDDAVLFVQILASLLFYTFVLLPTALKFDFRRDLERFTLLKAMPLKPVAVAAGQLAVPVVLSTLFQASVLSVTMLSRPMGTTYVATGLLILFPLNVFIFAFENLVFLLYPHPLKEEGLVVFFRSVLTFTAKGLLFAFGMAMFIVLAIVARETGGVLMPEDKWLGTRIVFTAASVVAGSAASLGTLFLLARSFRRFDPSRSALSG